MSDVMKRPRWASRLALAMSALLVLAACGTTDPIDPCAADPSLCQSGPDTTAQFFGNLPSWQAFAQPDSVAHNDLNVAGDTLPITEEIVDSVPVFGANGIDSILTNVRYVCQSKPYTLSDTPDQIVMYDPNRSILYAGAMIQGKSHKNQVGSLQGLQIAERNPITVSIPDLPTGANQRTVFPTQGNVDSVRGEMIGSAVANDLATPSSSHFEMASYHSEASFALSSKLSARYLRFEGTASGSTSRGVSETTVTAHYTEKMYTVTVEPPVGGFFSEDFTNEVLANYVGQKLIGPDNLPVYISEIVYGRSMMFSVTSSASESQIRAAMQASYDGLVNSGSGSIDVQHKTVLQNSRIAITSLGGPAAATQAMIQSGDWTQYFTHTAQLSEAVPISYTFTNVGDGSVAAVTEATSYNITTCDPKPLVPGVFDFQTLQTMTVPLSPGYSTYYGDVDGDGRGDMIFNERAGAVNNLAVAFGQADGSFSTPSSADSTTEHPTGGWSLYDDVLIGDFNHDTYADVMLNRKDSLNLFYVALSNGDGTFTWGSQQQHPMKGWGSYKTLIADVDLVNGDDLIWNIVSGGQNRTYVGLSNGDGTFDLTGGAQDQIGTCCWSGTDVFTGDVNGDGLIDMMYSRTDANDNANWMALGHGDGTFDTSDQAFTHYGGPGWADYKALTGDINGDHITDLIWVADARSTIPIHRAMGIVTTGLLDKQSWQHVPDSANGTGPFELRMGDVDGDFDTDIILVDLDGTNNRPVNTNGAKIWVGLATDDQLGIRFDFKPVEQIHPQQDTWGQYEVHVMDVNGDHKVDVVIHHNATPHRIYVALAK